MAGILIDTNVLVYAFDRREFEKMGQANRVLEQLHLHGQGWLSAQVLAEFYRASTRGAEPILSAAEAQRQSELLSASWPVLALSAQVVLEAIRGAREHQLAYWDAQVWATAKLNQIPVVLSEDLPSARTVEGVRFVNPIDPDFQLENWV